MAVVFSDPTQGYVIMVNVPPLKEVFVVGCYRNRTIAKLALEYVKLSAYKKFPRGIWIRCKEVAVEESKEGRRTKDHDLNGRFARVETDFNPDVCHSVVQELFRQIYSNKVFGKNSVWENPGNAPFVKVSRQNPPKNPPPKA